MAQPHQPLVSKNSLFWRPDAQRDAARKHPGWVEFHRLCGRAGLCFDDIEPVPGSRRDYAAIAFRHERRGDLWLRYKVSEARGPGPIGAVLAAFDAAVSAGWPVDPAVADLLRSEGAAPIAPAAPSVAPEVIIEDWELV